VSRGVQGQAEERRGLDRRIKDLEVRLSAVLSAKARDDEEHAARVKVRTRAHPCMHACMHAPHPFPLRSPLQPACWAVIALSPVA
jgi:hypothetical protein